VPSFARAESLFFEDFETDLSLWTNETWTGRRFPREHHGIIVPDPLESDNALTFTSLGSRGDIFTDQKFSSTTKNYTLSFDYLGMPGQGGLDDNLGGFIGYRDYQDNPQWLAGTDPRHNDILPDTGQWEHLSIDFETQDNFRLMIEDWVGIPGDAYFDNIRLSTVGEGNGVKEYDTALILAETKDYGGFPSHPDNSEFVALGNRLNDYFQDISYGQVGLNSQILDDGGDWYELGKNASEYVGSEKELIDEAKAKASDSGIDLSNYDMSLVVHSGFTEENNLGELASMVPIVANSEGVIESYDALVAEFNGHRDSSWSPVYDLNLGTYAHEAGHILGVLESGNKIILPDIYQLKSNMDSGSFAGKYDLMASGNRNDDGRTPAQMSSFTKELLGWLEYEDITLGTEPLEISLKSLGSMNPLGGDKIKKLGIDDEKYYILEARTTNDEPWDKYIGKSGLVIYEVDTNGKDFVVESLAPDTIDYNWEIDLKSVVSVGDDPYYDFLRQTEFSVVNSDADGKNLEVKVEKKSWPEKLFGFVMSNSEFLVRSALTSFTPLEPIDIAWPDLDLHLFMDDGRHIGMNYDTGLYERGIPGALASGDMVSSDEWIMLPEGITGYHFLVSSYDTEKFLQNVAGGWELTDGMDKYLMRGAFNDPETGNIYESSLFSSNIYAGSEMEWLINYSQDTNEGYNVNISRYEEHASTVPEPATFLLFSSGALLTMMCRRRKKTKDL